MAIGTTKPTVSPSGVRSQELGVVETRNFASLQEVPCLKNTQEHKLVGENCLIVGIIIIQFTRQNHFTFDAFN